MTTETTKGELKLENEETGETKTVNVTVANLPLFDENGMLIYENIPVSTTMCEARTHEITTVSESKPDRGIAVLMAEDAKEAYNSDDSTQWTPR